MDLEVIAIIEVFLIPQISKAWALPSDGLMSYPRNSLAGEGSNLSAKILQPQPTGIVYEYMKYMICKQFVGNIFK